jgi:hypothetical protein
MSISAVITLIITFFKYKTKNVYIVWQSGPNLSDGNHLIDLIGRSDRFSRKKT